MKTTIILFISTLGYFPYAVCMEHISDSFQATQSLFTAIKEREYETVRLIISNFPETVNMRDQYGRTPLYASLIDPACPIRFFNIAQVLIQGGADVNRVCDDVSDYHSTLLHEAAMKDGYSVDIIRFLLKNGANKKLTNAFGEIPLHCAIQKHNGYKELIDLLT